MCEAVMHQNEMDTAVCDMTCRRPERAAEPILVRSAMGTIRVWKQKARQPEPEFTTEPFRFRIRVPERFRQTLFGTVGL